MSRIRILDAAGGMWTSRRAALEGIGAGRFTYVDEHTVRVNQDHRGHLACIVSIEDARSRRESDGGMATLDGIAGLPCLMPVKLITDPSKGPHRAARYHRDRDGRIVSIPARKLRHRPKAA